MFFLSVEGLFSRESVSVSEGRCQQQKLIIERTLNFGILFMGLSHFQLPKTETTRGHGVLKAPPPQPAGQVTRTPAPLAEEYKGYGKHACMYTSITPHWH